MTAHESVTPIEPGTNVEVRNQFDGSWCPGFQVDQAIAGGYILRRCRDGAVLPKRFPSATVRTPASSDSKTPI